MNPSEAALVLAHAAIADKRTIGEIECRFWARMLHPDITVEHAIQAVAEHYAETRDWLMPADVNTRARRIAGRHIAEARRAELATEIADAEQGQISDHTRPLAALTAGTPLKSVPRRSWQERHRIVKPNNDKPPFTDEELAAARKLLDDAAREAAR